MAMLQTFSFKKNKEKLDEIIKVQEHDGLWIARNKEGDLWLFSRKPHKGYEDVPAREIWCCSTLTPFCYFSHKEYPSLGCCLQLDDDMFPEVQYDNGPQQLILKNETNRCP